MAERRPLATPFANSPDADPETIRNFVKQEPREPAPVAAPVVEPVAERSQQAVRVVQQNERAAPEPRQPAEQRMSPLTRTKKKRASSITPVAPVPVTVRLKPEIAGALKRASLERQLAGEELFTQQDIVENLLEPWLHDQGYLD
jgi:hypothetical protein